jgi:hypothetical protein
MPFYYLFKKIYECSFHRTLQGALPSSTSASRSGMSERRVDSEFSQGGEGIIHTQRVRSKVRYWMASLTCSGVMVSDWARSATVRETFRMRS